MIVSFLAETSKQRLPRDAGFANAALQVDYDKNFLFYMTTKMPNPHYFPEVCIKAKR
jgi:hypothetical protein